MEGLLSGIIPIIIAIFVVTGIISSVRKAARKKRQQQAAQQGQQGQQQQQPQYQPQRQQAMSEIQRAFAMMSGEPEVKKTPPGPQQPTLHKQQHAEGMHSTHEGLHSRAHEGLHARYEGAHSKPHEGVAGKYAGEHSMPHTGKHEGQPSHEGFAQHKAVRKQEVANKYANVKIGKYFADGTGEEPDSVPATVKRRKANPLKLFEGKDAFTKAVIYSEILTRKSARR